MSLTRTRVRYHRVGHLIEAVLDFTFDASYPTGGEAVTPQELGLQRIETVIVAESPDGYDVAYDRATSKLQAFIPGGDIGIAFADGQDEAADNTYPVTGVAVGDLLLEATVYATKAAIATQTDAKALYSITATDVISGDGATNRTNNQVRFMWRKTKREVANAVNLSAVNGRMIVRGY